MRRRFFAVFATLVLVLAVACSDDNGDDTSNDGSDGDAGDVVDDEDGGDAVDGGDGGGDEDSGGSGLECPTDNLPSETSFTYEGSTIDNPNLFESTRLEWDDAGDDALLWVVPEDGTYEFSMENDLTDNGGCGISVRNQTDGPFHSTNLCPDGDEPRDLPDAYYIGGEGSDGSVELSKDQELLVLVSCAYWSTPEKEVDYSITIEQQ